MAEISRYGKEWERVVKRNRKLIYEVPEPIAYWVFQTLKTFWECNFKELSENDKKYIGQFINILKAKLKLRQVQM